MRRHLTPVRIAAGSTAIVFAAAFVISWESLRVLALAAGIRELLAPLYPVTIDAMMVTGTVAAVALRGARLRTRLYTWALIGAGIAVSVLGNAIHSQAVGGVLRLPWWASAGASAVPALSLAASLHLLVVVLRHGQDTGHDRVGIEDITSDDATVSELHTKPRPAKERLAALVRRHGADISADMVALRLGVSTRHAARLLAEVRRPRVMDSEAQ